MSNSETPVSRAKPKRCFFQAAWVAAAGVATLGLLAPSRAAHADSPLSPGGSAAPVASLPTEFGADGAQGGVWLRWQTGYESRNLGFNVYRQQRDAAGNWSASQKLNPQLIAGAALQNNRNAARSGGFAFGWADTLKGSTTNLNALRYLLESVDSDGNTTRLGPVGVAPGQGTLGDAAHQSSPLVNSTTGSGAARADGTPITTQEMPRSLTAIPAGIVNTQWTLAGRPALKIGVARNGWTRVSQEQMVAAGLPANTDPATLRLFVEGNELPLRVPQKAQLAPGDGVEFYGVPFDTPTLSTRTYWLLGGLGKNRPVATFPTDAANTTLRRAFYCTIEQKQRSFYYTGLLNGDANNFFGAFVYPSAPGSVTLPARNVLKTNGSLAVSMQGITLGVHTVVVSLNGTQVGTLSWTGRTLASGTFTAPAAALLEGNNQVTLTATGTSDFSLIDTVRMVYGRSLNAVDDRVEFPIKGGDSAQIEGFSGGPVRVMDVTDANSPFEIVPQDLGNGAVRLKTRGTGTRLLQAFSSQAPPPASVRLNAVSSLYNLRNGADEVIITPGAFSEGFRPLLNKRVAEGLQVRFVDVENVFDEFSYGHRTPEGIKAFLRYVTKNWARKPRFVLLGGDASYDPRNFTSAGDFDFVPTRLIDSELLQTSSDDWFTDFDDDGLAEVPIGRLPVRSLQAALDVSNKIAAYDPSPAMAQGRSVIMVSDTLRGYDFDTAAQNVAKFLPAGSPVEFVRRTEGDAAAHNHLLASWNNSPVLVTFFGHGSLDIWSGGSPALINSADAASLSNTQPLPLVLSMTCFTGWFQTPTIPSLCESLVLAPNGAIAAWGSSGEALPSGQEEVTEKLLQLLYPASGTAPTLGEAILAAKATSTDSDIRRNWVLFADPAMRVARPWSSDGS